MTSRHEGLTFKTEEEEESGEGLTTLIPDIQATARIVEVRIVFQWNLFKDLPYSNIFIDLLKCQMVVHSLHIDNLPIFCGFI